MTCVICRQVLTEPARAPRQPDRHRWCSDQAGRLVATARRPVRWTEPLAVLHDELHEYLSEAL